MDNFFSFILVISGKKNGFAKAFTNTLWKNEYENKSPLNLIRAHVHNNF